MADWRRAAQTPSPLPSSSLNHIQSPIAISIAISIAWSQQQSCQRQKKTKKIRVQSGQLVRAWQALARPKKNSADGEHATARCCWCRGGDRDGDREAAEAVAAKVATRRKRLSSPANVQQTETDSKQLLSAAHEDCRPRGKQQTATAITSLAHSQTDRRPRREDSDRKFERNHRNAWTRQR